ncbi:GntR family transcriptional regulator [Nocardiopsis aegyptia]|uniref:GntR family transcriptional regulator n=1 Tax=Nocardiopsis aegyptia TaxID=220378 RepID=A0A7Z0ESJ8_9ACTN|nr:GntR family transcriptional regulator [Nocardiopsis aegyptia]NYJ37496.1 GntR family transcriptional regulator [Nocardiopsis aegyptia]
MKFAEDEVFYRRIVDDLRAKIQRGELKPGDKLPSFAEIASEYGVSSTVIKSAIQALKTSGDIYGRQGKGTFVSSRRRAQRVRRIPFDRGKSAGSTFAQEMEKLGLEPSASLVKCEVEPASAEIAAHLGLPEGAEVLVRQRHMSASGRPVQLATSHIPMTVAGSIDIAFPDVGPTQMHGRLAERGHRPVRFSEEITIRRPFQEEADFLGVDGGLPVIVVTRTAIDAEGTLVEATVNVLDAYAWSLVYEWEENQDER